MNPITTLAELANLDIPEDASLLLTDVETGGLNGQIKPGVFGQNYYPLLQVAGKLLSGNFAEADLMEDKGWFNIVLQRGTRPLSDWSHDQFKDSLLPKCAASDISNADLDKALSNRLKAAGVKKGSLLLLGNSCSLDFDFIEVNLPETFTYLFYRKIDVSALKEFNKRMLGRAEPFVKSLAHDALEDCIETGKEALAYKAAFK